MAIHNYFNEIHLYCDFSTFCFTPLTLGLGVKVHSCFYHIVWIHTKSSPCIISWGCSPGWAMLWKPAYSSAVVIKVGDSSVHYGSVRFTGNDKEGFWSYYYPVTTPQWLHPAALLACSPASLIRLQRWSNWLLITAVFRPTGVLSSCAKEGERINPRKPRRIKHSNGFVA